MNNNDNNTIKSWWFSGLKWQIESDSGGGEWERVCVTFGPMINNK